MILLNIRFYKILTILSFVLLAKHSFAFAEDSLLQSMGKAKEKYYENLSKLGANSTVSDRSFAKKNATAEARQVYVKKTEELQNGYLKEGAKSLLSKVKEGLFPDVTKAESNDENLKLNTANPGAGIAEIPEEGRSKNPVSNAVKKEGLYGHGAAGASDVNFGIQGPKPAADSKLKVQDGIIQNH